MPDSVSSFYKVCNDNIFGLFGLISNCGTEQKGTLEEAKRAKQEYRNRNPENYVMFCKLIEGKQECRKI